MNISYLGHSCFKIETKPGGRGANSEKLTIITDPFSKEVGLKPPSGKVDLVLISHNHYDHNYTGGFKEGFFLIDSPGEYTYRGIGITGIKTYHDNQEGQLRGLNTVYVIKSESISVCHLGDLGHVLDKAYIDKIGEVDILLIPVGGNYTIGPKEAVEVVKAIEPKIVVPMHYRKKGVNIEDIEEPGAFYKELGSKPEEKVSKLNIKPSIFEEGRVKVIEFS